MNQDPQNPAANGPQSDSERLTAAGTQQRVRASNARVRAVRLAAGASLEHGPIDRLTAGGRVIITAVDELTDDAGLSRIEVRTAAGTDSGETHFVIYNPPLLVRDPDGPIETHGGRWREDPAAALAEVIASLGGARRRKGRRR